MLTSSYCRASSALDFVSVWSTVCRRIPSWKRKIHCERHHYTVLLTVGSHNALLHPHDTDSHPHIIILQPNKHVLYCTYRNVLARAFCTLFVRKVSTYFCTVSSQIFLDLAWFVWGGHKRFSIRERKEASSILYTQGYWCPDRQAKFDPILPLPPFFFVQVLMIFSPFRKLLSWNHGVLSYFLRNLAEALLYPSVLWSGVCTLGYHIQGYATLICNEILLKGYLQ